jgi:hypothetical protein
MRRGYRTSWDDAALAVQCLDLSGDFDPRTLRRHRGWALRRYRGEHRDRALSVTDLVDQVARHAEVTRRRHVRSLRRLFDPGPTFLGALMTNIRFYGVPRDPEEAARTAMFTWEQPEDQTILPLPAEPVNVDAADTGPIITASGPTGENRSHDH